MSGQTSAGGFAVAQSLGIELATSELSRSDEARLDQGRLLTSILRAPSGVEVKAAINCSPSRAFAAVTNFEALPQRIFGLESAQVLSRSESKTTASFSMKLPFPVGRLRWTNEILTSQVGDIFTAEWTLISGDLKTNQGRLVVGPYRGNTNRALARFLVRVETRSGLPKSAERLATRWLLPKIVNKLRHVVEVR